MLQMLIHIMDVEIAKKYLYHCKSFRVLGEFHKRFKLKAFQWLRGHNPSNSCKRLKT